MILPFGIHDVDAAVYHDDPSETPSLSASIANILIGQSPAHAHAAHPKLNPDHERDTSDRFDVGTCAHELFLRGDNLIEIVPFADWRTTAAKEARDDARANGRIPLLPDQADRVLAMVAAAREQAHNHSAQPPLFTHGKPEQTLIWEDDHSVICRSRLDWLRDDHTAIDDLKTTSASAEPSRWSRTAYSIGVDLQVALYIRGVERLTGTTPIFRYVVIENYPPYALSVVDLAPAALALGRDKAQRAIDLWARCLATGEWPGYDRRVASMEVPTWAEMAWLEWQEIAA